MQRVGYLAASLTVTSSILTGFATALIIEIPLTKTLGELTYNGLLCILSIGISIIIQKYLQGSKTL